MKTCIFLQKQFTLIREHLLNVKVSGITLPAIIMLSVVFGINLSAQTLTSDRYDYAPGSIATLNGCGFQPGEKVEMQVVEYYGPVDTASDHLPWYVVADANGCFVTTWCVCEPDVKNTSFLATATGVNSGLYAEVVFADAVTGGAANAAGFGIDGDLYANHLQFGYFRYNSTPYYYLYPYGPWADSSGIANQDGTDDWFKSNAYTGKGIGIIDTTGAAALKLAAAVNPSLQHVFDMAYPPFSVVHGTSPTVGAPDEYPPVILLDAVAARDGVTPDSSVFLGSNKNGQDPRLWDVGPQNVQSKDDILDVGAHLRINPSEGNDMWAIFFATREATNGDSHLDFELYRADLSYNGSAFSGFGPDSGHTAFHLDATDGHITKPGDVILITDYTNGGGNPAPIVCIYTDTTHLAGELNPPFTISEFNALPAIHPRPFSFTGVTFEGPSPYVFAAITTLTPMDTPVVFQRENDIPFTSGGTGNTLATPWGNQPTGTTTEKDSIQEIQFVEVGVNFTELGLDYPYTQGPCSNIFGTLLVKTRASQSFSATLEDFAGPFPFGSLTTIVVSAHSPDTTLNCLKTTATLCATANSSSEGTISYCWQGPDSATGPCLSTNSCINVSQPGKYYITVSVDNGCTVTDSIVVTEFIDSIAPALSCPPTINVTCPDSPPARFADGKTGLLNFIAAGGNISDNIGGMGLDSATFKGKDNGNVAAGSCGSFTRTYSIADNCGNVDSCIQTVNVTTTAVVVVCNEDTTVSACASQSTVNNAFNAWLAGFSASGGCNRSSGFVGTPIAPSACGGSTSVTYSVTSSCESDKVCTRTFTVTNAPAVSVTCNDDTTVASCTGQSQVNSLFAKWLAGFSFSGGCNTNGSFNGTPVAPAACGGSTNVTYTVTSDCESAKVCTKTFTVSDAPAVSVTCNDDTTSSSCQTQGQINAQFAAWLAGFSYSGGCNTNGSFSTTPVAPLACGGSTSVTYTVTSDCESAKACTRTFTVADAPAVSVTCNDDTTIAACTDQATITAKFNAWKNGFSFSGGCNASGSFNGTPAAPAACGGSTTVVYTVSSDCESAKVCTRTFTVSDAPAVSVTCNDDTTIAACTNQATITAKFNAWKNGFSFSGGCNASGSFNGTPAAPAACGGSTTVVYTVSSDCESAKVCTRTFTVTTPPAVDVTCNDDTTVSGLNQSEITTAFNNWLAGFSASGGCDLSSGFAGNPVAPDKCGGSTTVTYTTTSSCASPTSCTRTFTVALDQPNCSIIHLADPVCGSTGNLIVATGSGGTGSYSFEWTSGWNITSGADNDSAIYTAGGSGSATFKVVVTDGIGCTSSCSDTVTCTSGLQGCTVGFWKNHTSIWKDGSSDIPKCIFNAIVSIGPPYSGNGTTGSSFASTFGLTASEMTAAGYNPGMTLLQALNLGGGGFFKLARQGVASLLDACSINYKYSAVQVATMMHNAIVSLKPEPTASMFAEANETLPDQCPAAGKATKRNTDDVLSATDNITINAYPNPFSNTTTIEFSLNSPSSRTIVEVYNFAGEKVATLFDGIAEIGKAYTVQFNGEYLAEGVYYSRITTENGYNFNKMVLIK